MAVALILLVAEGFFAVGPSFAFRFPLSLLAYCVIDSSFVPFGLLVLDYLVGRRRTQLQ